MCCTQLAGNTGCKNDAKNRHLRTIAEFCRTVSSQLRHVSTIGKLLLNSNMSSTCPHNLANFGPLIAEICWQVWGTPANFNGSGFVSCLRYCSDVAHWRPTKLWTMFGHLLAATLYIHFWGLLPSDRVLPGAKFASVLLYWQRYCMVLQQRASAKLCGVVQGMAHILVLVHILFLCLVCMWSWWCWWCLKHIGNSLLQLSRVDQSASWLGGDLAIHKLACLWGVQ